MKIKSNLKNAKKLYMQASNKHEKLVKLYPEVKKVLNILIDCGHKIGIVTSKDKSRTFKIVKKFKLKFSTIQCPGKNIKGKPNKDLICRALIKTKFNKKNTFYIGDTNIDYITSKRAGVNFIFAKYGYGRLKKKSQYSISKFSDVLKFNK